MNINLKAIPVYGKQTNEHMNNSFVAGVVLLASLSSAILGMLYQRKPWLPSVSSQARFTTFTQTFFPPWPFEQA